MTGSRSDCSMIATASSPTSSLPVSLTCRVTIDDRDGPQVHPQRARQRSTRASHHLHAGPILESARAVLARSARSAARDAPLLRPRFRRESLPPASSHANQPTRDPRGRPDGTAAPRPGRRPRTALLAAAAGSPPALPARGRRRRSRRSSPATSSGTVSHQGAAGSTSVVLIDAAGCHRSAGRQATRPPGARQSAPTRRRIDHGSAAAIDPVGGELIGLCRCPPSRSAPRRSGRRAPARLSLRERDVGAGT
jgi:hypothetical protein